MPRLPSGLQAVGNPARNVRVPYTVAHIGGGGSCGSATECHLCNAASKKTNVQCQQAEPTCVVEVTVMYSLGAIDQSTTHIQITIKRNKHLCGGGDGHVLLGRHGRIPQVRGLQHQLVDLQNG